MILQQSGRRSPEDRISPPKRKAEDGLRKDDDSAPEDEHEAMDDDPLGDVFTAERLPESVRELLVGHITKMVKQVDL